MENYGFYTEYPEFGMVKYEDNNGNKLVMEDIKYINGESCLTLDNAEQLARWCIKNGNQNGYSLLEHIMKVRLAYNSKKIK